MQKKNQQKGFTLVELMIAATLSLVIIGGTIQVYAANKNTYNLQQGLARMQESGRFALLFIQESTRMAGFSCAASTISFCGTVNPISTTNTKNDQIVTGAVVSDQLEIQYVSSAAANTDCQGAAAPLNTLIQNHYFLQFNNAKNTTELMCASNISAATVLVEGIDKMHVLYGIDADADGVANFYQTSTNADTDANWNNVVSLKVAVLASSVDEVLSAADGSAFTLLDSPSLPYADRRQRQVFSTTIILRNQLSKKIKITQSTI